MEMLKHYNFVFGKELIEVTACTVVEARQKAMEIYKDIQRESNQTKRPREST